MEVGITTTCSDWSVDAATVARMVEDAGIPLLCFGEHTHIPASRETPYPGGAKHEHLVLTYRDSATNELREPPENIRSLRLPPGGAMPIGHKRARRPRTTGVARALCQPQNRRTCRQFPKTGATGLEPATSGVTGRRSNRLSYAPRVLGIPEYGKPGPTIGPPRRAARSARHSNSEPARTRAAMSSESAR